MFPDYQLHPFGRQVLIGIIFAETQDLARLDARLPLYGENAGRQWSFRFFSWSRWPETG